MSDIKRCDYNKEEIDSNEEYYVIDIKKAQRNSTARTPIAIRDCCAKCFKNMEPKARIGRPRKRSEAAVEGQGASGN